MEISIADKNQKKIKGYIRPAVFADFTRKMKMENILHYAPRLQVFIGLYCIAMGCGLTLPLESGSLQKNYAPPHCGRDH